MPLFSAQDIENARKALDGLQAASTEDNGGGANGTAGGKPKKASVLTPARLLVIAGLLSDALVVDSVLVDRDQNIEIVITGSLKRKTQLDTVMRQIGQLPFEEVVAAIVGNAT